MWHCSSPPVLWPVRSPCRTTPRLLPSVLGSRPLSRRPRTPRRRLPLHIAASRMPASSSRRSPRPPPWSRRLQLPVSACHLRLPRSRPRSSSHLLFDLRRRGRRRTSPSGGCSAQRPPAGEYRPRLLHHQLCQLA
jgi:hypothetical protein